MDDFGELDLPNNRQLAIDLQRQLRRSSVAPNPGDSTSSAIHHVNSGTGCWNPCEHRGPAGRFREQRGNGDLSHGPFVESGTQQQFTASRWQGAPDLVVRSGREPLRRYINASTGLSRLEVRQASPTPSESRIANAHGSRRDDDSDRHVGRRPEAPTSTSVATELLQRRLQCTGAAWQNGNLNANQAHYREGESIPFRLVMEGMSPWQPHDPNRIRQHYQQWSSRVRLPDIFRPHRNHRQQPLLRRLAALSPRDPGPIPADREPRRGAPRRAAGPWVISIFNGIVTSVSYLVPHPAGPEGSSLTTSVRHPFSSPRRRRPLFSHGAVTSRPSSSGARTTRSAPRLGPRTTCDCSP